MEFLNSVYCWFAELKPAVWVALIALVTSVVVACQNWRHNRLSVIPNLDLHRDISVSPPTVSLDSNGIGPAIVEELVVEAEGEFYLLNTISGMEAFAEKYASLLADHSPYKVLSKGVYIKAGETVPILNFKPTNEEPDVGGFIKHLKFTGKWKSVYGQDFDESFKFEDND